MSVSKEIIKKVNKRVTKAKNDLAAEVQNIRNQVILDLARAIVALPLRQRIKLAYNLIIKGKL